MRPLPLIVYKYRNWENISHRNTLIYNEIYLASPKDFNDPFDCRITPNLKSLTPEEEKQYIIDMGIAYYPMAEEQKQDLGKALNNFESRLRDKDKMQKEYKKKERLATMTLFEIKLKTYRNCFTPRLTDRTDFLGHTVNGCSFLAFPLIIVLQADAHVKVHVREN